MTNLNPIAVAIVDNTPVAKSAVRGYELARVRMRVADANEVRNTDFSGQSGGIYVASLEASFDLNTGDATSADDGFTIIVDAAGNRFVRVTGAQYFDVTVFGAFNNNSNAAATTTAIQAAINAASAAGGGIVWFPVGTYLVSTTLNVPSLVYLVGAVRYATTILCGSNDITVVNVTGSDVEISNLQIEGKGFDTSSFGASHAALLVSGNNSRFSKLTLYGGTFALDISGSNNYFEHVGTTQSYGAATCRNGGGNYFHRCDFDNQGSGITSASTMPYAAWAATTSISLHETRLITNGGNTFACVATVAGTTGGGAPTMKNYLQPFTDGSVTWSLQAPQTYYGLQVTGSGVSENHLDLCDFTGVGYSASVNFAAPASGPVVVDIFNSDVSYGVTVGATANTGAWINIAGCELGGGNGIGSGNALNVTTGYSGVVTCTNNYINSPPGNIIVGAGVSDFNIANNLMNGSSITVNAGASDNYTIFGNENATVTDNGTGTHKTVENAGTINAGALVVSALSSSTATIPNVYGGSAAGSTLNLQSTASGSPSGDKVTITAGGAARITVLGSNKLGFGTETSPQMPFVFSGNAVAAINPTGLNANLFYLIGPDTTNPQQVFLAYGGFGSFLIARADGTAASPTATAAGDRIGQIGFAGYNQAGTTFTSAKARMGGIAVDSFDSTHAGACLQFDTTPSASTTIGQVGRFMQGFIVGTGTTDPGIGNLQASGKLTPGSFTVGTLPSGVNAGDSVYASNCRVFNGAGTQEGAGSGTGGLVNYNGSAWKIAGTNVTAVA